MQTAKIQRMMKVQVCMIIIIFYHVGNSFMYSCCFFFQLMEEVASLDIRQTQALVGGYFI